MRPAQRLYKRSLPVWLLVAVMLLSVSCQTYHIPVESFREQFARDDHDTMRDVRIRNPVGRVFVCRCNSFTTIEALDGHGASVRLPNKPSLEIRFTDTAGGRTTFYFSTLHLDGRYVTGYRSWILGFPKTVDLGSVREITLQDGKKRFGFAP